MHPKHLLLIAMLALVAACGSKEKREAVDENLSEVELYQQAQRNNFV